MIYIRYLRSVLLHKLYVYQAGRRLRLGRWQLLIHDLSKFSRAEFGPYARRFGKGTGGSLNHETEAQEWRDAWAHHWQNNPHHWEYWMLANYTRAGSPDDWTQLDDGTLVQPMPLKYACEMVADWCGASKGYTGSWDIREWYAANTRLRLHPDTRAVVEQLIAEWSAEL